MLTLQQGRMNAGLCPCGRTRDVQFKKCLTCRKHKRENERKHWGKRKFWNLRDRDRDAGRITDVPGGYMDDSFLVGLRTYQENKCYYCTVPMQTINMMLPDGLTVERLDNRIAHLKTNCVLACHTCNVHRVGDGINARWLESRKLINVFRRVMTELLARQKYFEDARNILAANEATSAPRETLFCAGLAKRVMAIV